MSYRDEVTAALARVVDAENRVREAEARSAALTAELAEIRRLHAERTLAPLPALLYLGQQGMVNAIDRATGKKVWSHPVPGSDPVLVVFDGVAVYAASNGHVHRVEAASGAQVWENGLRGLGYGLPALAASGPGFPHHDRLFVALGGDALALDKANGEILWKVDLPAKGPQAQNLVLLGDELYVLDGGELSCLDPRTGQTRWHNPLPRQGTRVAGLAPGGLDSFRLLAAAEHARHNGDEV